MSMPGFPAGNASGAGLFGRAQIGTIATIAAVVLFMIVILVSCFGDAEDGEPKQVIKIDHTAPSGTGAPAPVDSSAPAPTSLVGANGIVIADPALIETAPEGALPRIADDGRKPMDVYSRPSDRSDPRPKIAVVIGGLGLGEAVTQAAVDRLPAGVTLAVTPYGAALQGLVSTARAKGHEVLLELPLEPYDYPDNDPGQDTLMTGAQAGENAGRFKRVMARVTGYAGLINSQGAKFLSSEPELAAMFQTTASRGLYFVDGGQAEQSIAREVAQSNGAGFARGDRQIDRNPTREGIEREFTVLEELAKQRGSAIGVAAAFPVTIDRVTAWAQSLEEKGIALVPVSALVDLRPVPTPAPAVSATPKPRRAAPAKPRPARPAAPVELPSNPEPAFGPAPHP